MSNRERYYEIIQSEMAVALVNQKYILIQSSLGLGKNHLVALAAKDVGLNLVSATLIESDVYFGKEEKLLRNWKGDFLSKDDVKAAQALLVEIGAESDMNKLEMLASDLKVPLIVSITSDTDIHIGVFTNKDKFLEIVKKTHESNNVLKKDEVLARIQKMQMEPSTTKTENKLGM